ncbi:MAG: hypothetical protein ACON31_10280 [Candidatus Puniceispirillaceae bacterium]
MIYAGAGTSIRIAVQDGVELGPTFDWPSGRLAYLVAGGHGALMTAVENAEDDVAAAERDVDGLGMTPSDILIALSASGRTPFTCAAASPVSASATPSTAMAEDLASSGMPAWR